MGSGTLATWIQQNLDKDNGVPAATKIGPAQDPPNTQRELMFGYKSQATFVDKRQSMGGGEVFVFKLDTLTVTPNPASSNAKWVTPVKEGEEHMIGLKDF